MAIKIKRIIPNLITTTRMILAIIIPILFINNYILPSVIVFFIAAISDFLDGYLARKWNVISNYGKTIDPLADKMIVIGILILIAVKINVLYYVILFMEVLIFIIGIIVYKKNKKVFVEQVGKIKMALLFPSIGIGLLSSLITDLEIFLVPMIGITIIFQILSVNEYAKNFSSRGQKRNIIIEEDSSITIING